MIRREYCDVYNVLHTDCAGKLCTNILSMTTYTWIDYIEQDRKFVKLFHTAMNNSMDVYLQRLHFSWK